MSCFLGSNFRNRGISKGNRKGHAIQLDSTRLAVITNIFEQKFKYKLNVQTKVHKETNENIHKTDSLNDGLPMLQGKNIYTYIS